jgi:pimeloyl-ACP methyl ester carboxylesterase
VFAVDLLGFGGSDKVKEGVDYELELWRDLLVDFMEVRMGVES